MTLKLVKPSYGLYFPLINDLTGTFFSTDLFQFCVRRFAYDILTELMVQFR